jgi:GTP-binding protein
MLDNDLTEEIRGQLPSEIPHIFISSVAGTNIMQLKDMIWEKLNAPL